MNEKKKKQEEKKIEKKIRIEKKIKIKEEKKDANLPMIEHVRKYASID